jgi:hypothetical protein
VIDASHGVFGSCISIDFFGRFGYQNRCFAAVRLTQFDAVDRSNFPTRPDDLFEHLIVGGKCDVLLLNRSVYNHIIILQKMNFL